MYFKTALAFPYTFVTMIITQSLRSRLNVSIQLRYITIHFNLLDMTISNKRVTTKHFK